jgi:hypothetical protein
LDWIDEIKSHRETRNNAMSGNIERVKPTELTSTELELVSGGLSFNYSSIELTYAQQKLEGPEPAPKPNR